MSVAPDQSQTVSPPPVPALAVSGRRNPGRRSAALIVFVGAIALLAMAAWLSPDRSGLGTHHQLGLPPCNWVTAAGVPCPTCGMTTAFAAAADGDLLASLRAQPFGCVLAIATAAAAVVAAFVAATGGGLGGHLLRLVTPRVGWFILVFALAAWLYKIASFRGLLP
ncbi:MAG: DUF2752 domain-containing protein [Phycisphaerae bacterium]|nr:DUF2752 domain-containing protein [Phycisphaerae bacterium]